MAVALIPALAALPCRAHTESQRRLITTNGQLSTFGFSSLPLADGQVTVTVTMVGDYDSASEYAMVTIEGVPAGTHQGASTACGVKGGAMSFLAPASAVNSDRRLTVLVDNSAAVSASECPGGSITVKLDYSSRELIMNTFTCAGEIPGYGPDLVMFFQAQNVGADPVGEFLVTFYYSPDQGTDNLVSLNSMAFPGLDAGAATPNSQLVGHLPREVQYGQGYIHYFVDAQEAVPEANETNNHGYRPITITGKPDLTIEGAGPPTVLAPGELVSLDYLVRNHGATMSDPVTFDVVYSVDAEITPADIHLGQSTVAGVPAQWWEPPLGDSIDVRMPTNVPEGRGYLALIVDPGDVVDESDETNNILSFDVALSVPRPDFELTLASIDYFTSAHRPHDFELALTNTGRERSKECIVEVYYSPDPARWDTLIGKLSFAPLDPGASSPAGQLAVETPATVLEGPGYWHFVIDPDDNNGEADETNNLVSRQMEGIVPPSHSFDEFAVAPGLHLPGWPVTLTLRVASVGGAMNPGPIELRIHLTSDSLLDGKDILLATVPIPPIPVGQTYPPAAEEPLKLNVTLPAETQPGQWRLGWVIEADPSAPPSDYADSYHIMVTDPGPAPRISDITLRTGPAGREVDLVIVDTVHYRSYRIDYRVPPWSGDWIEMPGATFAGASGGSIRWIDGGGAGRNLDSTPVILYRVVVMPP